MIDELYRDTAIEIYASELKRLCPDIKDQVLESFKSAFLSGFNIGTVAYEDRWIKELALKSLISND